MKQSAIIFLLFVSIQVQAQNDFLSFDAAKDKSKIENKNILLVFSGSDWCKPCIELKKNILESKEFAQKSDDLILLYLDFPYKKSNRLSKVETKHNEELAELYNPSGAFPKIILVDQTGQIQNEILYEKGMEPHEFITQLKKTN